MPSPPCSPYAAAHPKAANSDSDRAAGIFGVLATGFSVLLGFLIFLGFESYDAARTGAETEALTVVQQVQNASSSPPRSARLATDPLTNPDAPRRRSPWGDYQLAAQADAERLDAEAEVNAAIVRRNIQRSANYVLAVVLFAVALFFAGMSTNCPVRAHARCSSSSASSSRARGVGRHLPDQRVRVTEASRILTDAFANTPRIM